MTNVSPPFEANWDSLKHYKIPQWFQDAKLGIFIHWGLYSVPAYDNEWYSRNMYLPESHVSQYHRETWGDQTQFGYKDFIPLFTAEHFDPDVWIDLFQKAGARYVVPVAEHHDGFAMYDSLGSDALECRADGAEARHHWCACGSSTQKGHGLWHVQSSRGALVVL
jgi:alpha-L-fucosidase